MSIQLLNKRVLLRQVKVKDTGIITPNDIERYIVFAVGNKVKNVVKGMEVMYDSGRKLLVKDEEFILTDEENIILIV